MKSNLNKLKLINNISFAIAVLSVIIFALYHYGFLSLQSYDVNPKAYFATIAFFATSMIINMITEINIQKLTGEKIEWKFIILMVAVLTIILVYAAYLYTLPLGFCPIRNFFSGGSYNQIELK